MATPSQDKSQGATRAKGARKSKPSITTHPAFAVIVALWFAALLGIGSLILPIALVEKLVVASGLPSLVSVTAPPLGFTARAGIALGFTIVGAAIGYIIARRLGRSAAPAQKAQKINPSEVLRRQPVNAHEELGQEGFDGKATGRRRALALQQEDQPSDFLKPSSIPGEAEAEEEAEFLELDEVAAFTEVEDFPVQEDVLQPSEEEPSVADKQFFHADAFEATALSQDGAQHSFETETEFEEVAELEEVAGLEEVAELEEEAETSAATQFEPLPFTAPSRLREDARREQQILETIPQAASAGQSELAELSLLQLVKRLSETIDKHREWSASQQQTETAPIALAAAMPEAFGNIANGAFDGADDVDPEEARQAFFTPDEAPAETGEADIAPEIAGEEAPAQAAQPEPDPQAEARQEFLPQKPYQKPEVQQLQPFAGLAPLADNEDEQAEEADSELQALSDSFSLPSATPAQSAKSTAAAEPATTPLDFSRPASEPVSKSDEAEAGEEAEEAEEAEAEAEPEERADFGSLSKLGNPFTQPRNEFVRVEAPEPDGGTQSAVVFPGDAPDPASRAFDPPTDEPGAPEPASIAPVKTRSSGAEADRALRDALLNLQKIGKAS